MRLTIRTNLAMRTLMFCAANEGRTVCKSEVAQVCNASENHLAQVVRQLGQCGFIEATRGRNGGMRLARKPSQIVVGEVFREFEGFAGFAECFEGGENNCPLAKTCWLRPALEHALEAFYKSLDRLTLQDLVGGNDPLLQLLTSQAPRLSRRRMGLPCAAVN
jgi:Rrf2 family transcriptional regulator, nitric oxide-sensitive transcriptional repressor